MDDEHTPEAMPPGARDARTMSATAFKLARFLSPQERAALAARPRFYRMPWLQLVANDQTPGDNRDDDLLP